MTNTVPTDTAYNELTQVVSGNLMPFIAYFLHVHDAQTPEPEGTATRMIQVWFTIHPTDSGLPTAASDIIINYSLGGDATAGTDYTAPSTNTVTLAKGESRVSIDIPILGDSDTGKETFTVTIDSASASGGEDVVLADPSAIVTIGDPNENAIYFFPNRPLVEGDTDAFLECYVIPPTGVTFTDTAALMSFSGSGAVTVTSINGNTLVDRDLSPYIASLPSLLSVSTSRSGLRLDFRDTHTSAGYRASRDTYSFACHGLRSTSQGGLTDVLIDGGSFGQFEYGQAYATE